MKKRVISFVLILAMFGMFVPMEAFASPQTHPNTYTNTGDQRADIIGVAKTQIGYEEGSNKDTKYGDWLNHPHQNWCAMFVSWCAWQANIPSTILKPSIGAGHSENYFNIPYYDGNNYTPKPGDLFFTKKTATTEEWGHVGLVYYTDGDYFYSIEGNSKGGTSTYGVRSNRWYKYNCYFGVPNYTNSATQPADYPDNYKVSYSRVLCLQSQYMNGSDVLYMQHCLKYLGYSLDTDGWYGPGTASVVKQFQSDYGVSPVDGQCGSITWKAIETAVYK